MQKNTLRLLILLPPDKLDGLSLPGIIYIHGLNKRIPLGI